MQPDSTPEFEPPRTHLAPAPNRSWEILARLHRLAVEFKADPNSVTPDQFRDVLTDLATDGITRGLLWLGRKLSVAPPTAPVDSCGGMSITPTFAHSPSGATPTVSGLGWLPTPSTLAEP